MRRQLLSRLVRFDTLRPDRAGRPSKRRAMAFRAGPFVVRDKVLHAGSRLAPHRHDMLNIVLVRSGCFAEETVSARFACEPGALLVEHPAESHRTDVGTDDVRLLTIEVLDEGLDVTARTQICDESSMQRSDTVAHLAASLDRELIDWDFAAGYAIEGLCLELVAALKRIRRSAADIRRPRWLDDVRTRLEILDRPATISDLAREIGVPAYRIQRAFRAAHGESPAQFVRRTKIAAAKGLLRDGHTIADIAAQLGFTDQSHLGRVFRRHVGVPPVCYRSARS